MRGDGAQVYRQVREISERSRGQEIVDEWQCGLEALGQRRVIDSTDEWVQPDQPVTAALQPGYLFAQHVGISAVPSVRDQQHDRCLMEYTPRPPLMKLAERWADSRAPRPIRHNFRNGVDSLLESSEADLPRHARQPGREQKHFEPSMAMGEAVREVKQHARVTLHGAAHIAQQHERPELRTAATSGQDHDLAAAAKASRQRPTDVDAGTAAANPPARATLAWNPLEAVERKPRAPHLFRRELGEVLVSQPFDLTPGLKDAFRSLIARAFVGGTLLWSQEAGGRSRASRRRARVADVGPFHRERVHVVTPERVERLCKGCQLIVSLHKQRAAGMEDLISHIDVDVGQRFGELEDAANRYLEAKAAKDASKDDEVFDEMAKRP